MAASFADINGLEELTQKLNSIAPAMRKKVLRNALAAGARLVRDEAKRIAPILDNTRNTPYRKPGTVRDAISVRTSKQARKAGDVGVFVNVRPAKGAQFRTVRSRILGVKSRKMVKASMRGANSRNDPFYWRFLEFGTNKMSARPFLKPASDKLDQSLVIIKAQLAKWFEKINSSGKVTP